MNASRLNDNLPLVILVLAHILCGPILGFFAFLDGPEIIDAIYPGLFFSQISLLGVWGGLGAQGRLIRLVGVTIGLAYLAPQYCFSVNDWDVLALLSVFLPTVMVAGAMLVIRRTMKLERTATTMISPNSERLRFSIRQMMLLTVVISCMLAIGRWLQVRIENPTLFGIVLFCYAWIAVTTVWATLGRTHLMRRSCLVLLNGWLMGCISYLAVGDGLWFWTTMMIVQAAVLLASLLVVRQCGFRLVRVNSFR